MRIFRVTVRGFFDGLTDGQRADLRARADEFDLLTTGGFSEAGQLSYERNLLTFSFRVQLRVADDDAEGPAAAHALALERGTALALDRVASELGVAVRRVRADATDMASLWEGRPAR